MLHVVTGPPASGKSTWVREHAQPGDVVIDYDRLAVALTTGVDDDHDHSPVVRAVAKAARGAAVDAALAHTQRVDVYVIHSEPGHQAMARYHSVGALVHVVDPGQDVVLARCARERPHAMLVVAQRWYREHGDVGVHRVQAVGVQAPTRRSRSW